MGGGGGEVEKGKTGEGRIGGVFEGSSKGE